jgi:hypothetical protein
LYLLFLGLSNTGAVKLGAKSQPETSRAEHELTWHPRAGGRPGAAVVLALKRVSLTGEYPSSPSVQNRNFPLGTISSDIVLRPVFNPYLIGSGINLS